MSRPQAVVELARELNRLAIAGTDLAVGDRRLTDLVPALERGGAKAPVLAAIAERTRALIGSERADAPARLLRLNALVAAVLKAQGRSGVEGELAAPPASTMAPSTLSARAIGALRDRLHSADWAAMRPSLERGEYADARLMPHALEALDSGDWRAANFAALFVLPLYGAAVVPALLRRLDPSDKRPAARLVEAVAVADAASGARLARRLLDPQADEGIELPGATGPASDEAMVAAVRALGDGELDRALLHATLESRKGALRIAASRRLIELGDEAATSRCLTMLAGPVTVRLEALDSLPRQVLPMRVEVAVRDMIPGLLEAASEDRIAVAEANLLSECLSLLIVPARESRGGDAELWMGALSALRESHECLHGEGEGTFRQRAPRMLGQELIHVLLQGLPEARHPELARNALPVEAGYTAVLVLKRFGPRKAWAFLQHASAELRAEGVSAVFPGNRGLGKESDPPFELPPAPDWNREWLAHGLEGLNLDVIDHLWELDPGAVAKRVLEQPDIGHLEHVLPALVAQPACAARLRGKLATNLKGREPFDALCAAIAAGDGPLAASSLDDIPPRYGRRRIARLRARLQENPA